MLQEKKRTRRYRAVASWMMLLCLTVAVGRVAVGLAPLFDPALTSAETVCTFWECEIDRDPRLLLPEMGGPCSA